MTDRPAEGRWLRHRWPVSRNRRAGLRPIEARPLRAPAGASRARSKAQLPIAKSEQDGALGWEHRTLRNLDPGPWIWSLPGFSLAAKRDGTFTSLAAIQTP